MSHHEAPQRWPACGEQLDGSMQYPTPIPGEKAAPMPELFPKYEYSPEENADNCAGVRALIDRQLDTLLGDDLTVHFTIRDILSGMIQLKNSTSTEES